MYQKKILISLIVLMLLFTLSCSTLTNIGQHASQTRGTVEAAVTAAVQLASVAPLVETAQVLATNPPALRDTAVALITQNPEMVDMIEAIATRGIQFGTAPEDIPLVDEAMIHNFFGFEALVTYTTQVDFQTVLNFYNTEMPKNGWESDPSQTIETANSATSTWNKPDRQAIVRITINPADNSTVVAITIQPR
jgi:hypothetical protein